MKEITFDSLLTMSMILLVVVGIAYTKVYGKDMQFTMLHSLWGTILTMISFTIGIRLGQKYPENNSSQYSNGGSV